jgi:hypothetical protein
MNLVWGYDENKCVPKSKFDMYANAYFAPHFAFQTYSFQQTQQWTPLCWLEKI